MNAKRLWGLVGLVALALFLHAAPQGKPAEKGKPAEAGKKDRAAEKKKEHDKQKKAKEEEEREKRAAQGRAIGKKDEETIRIWFRDKKNLEGLPPGLAKRDELPPGLQRHLEKNGTLPPGLQKRIQPLPPELEVKLPKTPAGVKRVVVAGNVILLEERTSKILDIVKDVMGEGGEKGSTGVRRTN